MNHRKQKFNFLKIKTKGFPSTPFFIQYQVDRQISCIFAMSSEECYGNVLAELNEIAAKRRDALLSVATQKTSGKPCNRKTNDSQKEPINYHGERLNDKPHGIGSLVGKKGVYTGDFFGGMVHGAAELTYSNGISYTGSVFAGRQHGHGLQRQSAGATVDGDFFASRIHGKAKIKWVSGNYIDGDFFDDQAHGQVRQSNGKVSYEGRVFAGLPHGQGTKIHLTEGVFDGNFFAGKPHGRGKRISGEGQVLEDGDHFAGVPHGYARMHHSTGTYEGECFAGRLHGYGQYTFNTGVVYRGMFFANEQHGPGYFTDATGKVTEAEFFNGKEVALGTSGVKLVIPPRGK